ncbi:peptidoglycan recognition family protein [Paenibacillus sp. H1-7]|uniref:peptidoglycan recognition protein family protein n=1 Tax=Paenibacillus sp. H1-7 TaxID=2282849 RepID=UPI001EF7CCDD|nr:peptidoglycan recognition family protein [Paenibacillus sp. H1-7]
MMAFRMKYDITTAYLTGPSRRRPMIPLEPCRFLVAHDTGNPGSTAANNVTFYERTHNDMEASAHLFVDDRSIIECIPFLTAPPEKAWHVRYDVVGDNIRYGTNANDAAGSIELCYGGSIDMEEAYRRYCWTLAYACYLYGLNPATDLIGHYRLDPQRRTDPVGALALVGKTFDDLIIDVAAEYEASLEPDILISPDDANKVIGFLSAAYFATDDAQAQAEFHRLANELRRVSGQL